jgi:hypothetical protein
MMALFATTPHVFDGRQHVCRVAGSRRFLSGACDKDNAFKLFTPWKSDKAQSTPTLDDLRERMAGDELWGIPTAVVITISIMSSRRPQR